ncbi:phage tail protein [Pseudomonas aeruginosa]|uniref:phage tail protein n=1 Tax=Pseudomonas aeruginosa TaxID=287 RepID=UPI0023B27124|nr:phage tail protein [Pseudomonas aeruginosa]MDE9812457.1 phage tail protein [Pseudomonas aeruginosa]
MYKLTSNPDVVQLLGGGFIPRGHPLWGSYEDWLAGGNNPEPLETPDTLKSRLVIEIDAAADAARSTVAGDPLRAVEYERAAAEAEAFKAAGYPAESVPRTVAAWAINGRTAQQAADNILAEAAAYTEALYLIRETRLQAKELVRQAMAAGNSEHAQDIAAETIASIQATVAGIGNAGA